MINEKLEKLNQEIAKGEARLRRAQHEEKILEHQVKQLMSLSIPRPLRRKLPLKIFTPVSISTTPKILRDTAFPFRTW